MTDFLKALRIEILAVENRIKELSGFAAEMDRLQKMIVKLEMVSDAYGSFKTISYVEDEELPSLAEAKESVAEDTEADKVVVASIRPDVAKLLDPPRAASPDVLAPRPKPVLATPAPSVAKANVVEPSLQRQQVLAEGAGIQACVFPSQVIGPKGKPVDVTEMQACMVAVLLSVTPSILSEKQIVERAYSMAKRRTTSGSTAMVSYEMLTLTNSLAPVGIKITFTKGIGYSIAAAS